MSYFHFSISPDIHFLFGPTDDYASVSDLLCAWEPALFFFISSPFRIFLAITSLLYLLSSGQHEGSAGVARTNRSQQRLHRDPEVGLEGIESHLLSPGGWDPAFAAPTGSWSIQRAKAEFRAALAARAPVVPRSLGLSMASLFFYVSRLDIVVASVRTHARPLNTRTLLIPSVYKQTYNYTQIWRPRPS
jgi:hypothetical protein